MIEQYKKTFWKTQILVTLVSLTVWALSHQLMDAARFFVVMQGCALIGAGWGVRLRNKVDAKSFAGSVGR